MKLPVGGPVVLLATLVASMFLGSSGSRNVEHLDAFEQAAEVFETNERRSRAQARRFALSGRWSPERGQERGPFSDRDALATGGSRLYNPVYSGEDFLPEPSR